MTASLEKTVISKLLYFFILISLLEQNSSRSSIISVVCSEPQLIIIPSQASLVISYGRISTVSPLPSPEITMGVQGQLLSSSVLGTAIRNTDPTLQQTALCGQNPAALSHRMGWVELMGWAPKGDLIPTFLTRAEERGNPSMHGLKSQLFSYEMNMLMDCTTEDP